MLEKKYNNYRYFITLTYDDDHIHNVNVIDTKTGEVTNRSTLVKDDMTNFIKNYRKSRDGSRGGIPHDYGKCRYFYCGEYGSLNFRSHFHMIMFQEKPILDLQPFSINENKQTIWISDTLSKLWGNGYVTVGEVTLESRGYVARYVTKKQTGERQEYYTNLGISPEFVQMSLKPGIGSQAFKDINMYKNDMLIMPNMKGKRQKLKPPRYFDEMLFEQDPELFQEIKDHRRDIAIIRRNQKSTLTTSDHWEQDQAEIKEARQKLLRRTL